MKNRMYSYGYGIINEKPGVIEKEASIVRRIFSDYISGKVLKQIAEELTEEKVIYYGERTDWNKNMIFRILENRKYCGADGYPPIISEELFEKASKIRASKESKKAGDTPENGFLKKAVFCGQCGKKMTRVSRWAKREKWWCSNGCKCSKYFDDTALHEAVGQVLKKIFDCPDLLKHAAAPVPYQKTQEIMRYTNEINRQMNASEPNFKSIKKLILECASLKFSVCRENKQDAYTDYVLAKTKEISFEKAVDVDYLQEVAKRIEIDQEGNILISFMNGAVVSSKEEVGEGASNGAEDRNENRRQSVAV